MIEPAELMRIAIEKCRAGIAAGQSPFGCAIARGDEILAAAHNTVRSTVDITAHAEINALREACRASGEILLTSAAVATTCEPCPMCMSALHWARVERVYYGCTIEDARRAGFNELPISAATVVEHGGNKIELVPGMLTDECRALFDQWRKQPDAQVY